MNKSARKPGIQTDLPQPFTTLVAASCTVSCLLRPVSSSTTQAFRRRRPLSCRRLSPAYPGYHSRHQNAHDTSPLARHRYTLQLCLFRSLSSGSASITREQVCSHFTSMYKRSPKDVFILCGDTQRLLFFIKLRPFISLDISISIVILCPAKALEA